MHARGANATDKVRNFVQTYETDFFFQCASPQACGRRNKNDSARHVQKKRFRPDVRNRLLFSALRRKPAGVEAKMTAHAMSKEKNAPGATSVPAKDRLRKGKLRPACRSLQRGRASMFFAWHTADCSANAQVEKLGKLDVSRRFPMRKHMFYN